MIFLFYVYILFIMLYFYALAKKKSIINNNYIAMFFQVNLIFISTLFIMITDINYTDRMVYSKVFLEIQNLSLIDAIDVIDWEPLFIILMKGISLFTSNPMSFYVLLHLFFLIILLKGLDKIYNNNKIKILSLFIYLNYPFYISYTLNGLRQGVAMALIILAIGYATENKKVKMILTLVFSVFFHYTTIPIAIFTVLAYYWKNIKISHFVIMYLIFSILYVTNLNQYIFGLIPVGDFESYFQKDAIHDFGGGNKLTYLVFNTTWLAFFVLMFKYITKDKVYLFLMKLYILFSIYFLMFGFIAYANRVASYSWFIIPIILAYIIYKSKNILLNMCILLFILIVGYALVISNFIF